MFKKLNYRSDQVEIMDDFDCQGEVVHQTLRELDFINQRLGGNAIVFNALNQLKKELPKDRPLRIVDLGCGSGEMLKLIRQWVFKNQLQVELIGVDVNPNIVAYAQQHCAEFPEIQFWAVDIFSDVFRKENFDLIISSLFTHHFSQGQLIDFYQHANQQARIGIITNDLHRNFLAYYSILWLTRWFSKSAMVKYDAPLSVWRGFKKDELKIILKAAGIEQYQLNWKWAFRWQLIIRT